MSNAKLHKAKKTKCDEFYTLYADIEKELEYYSSSLVGMSIYCPCDNPTHSNFYKYLKTNFNKFKLKSLSATYYKQDFNPLDSFIDSQTTPPTLTVYDGTKETITPLKGNRRLSLTRMCRNPEKSRRSNHKSPFQSFQGLHRFACSEKIRNSFFW